MLSSECIFCGHCNTADARFCNQCGGLLELKRCSECNAVNVNSAITCAKCRAELTIERDLFESVAARWEEPPHLINAGADPWSSRERSASVKDTLQPRFEVGSHKSVAAPIELVHRVRAFRGSVTLLSAAQRMARVVPARVHDERAHMSLANRVGLPLLLTATLILTVYWTYPLTASTAHNSRPNLQMSRAPAGPASTTAVDAAGTLAPATSVVSVDSAASPTVQGRIRTSGPKVDENENGDSTELAAALASAPAAEARKAPKASGPAPVVAHARTREPPPPVRKQTQREMDSVNARSDTYTLLMRASSGVSHRDKWRDDGGRSCTNDIAALGLCALSADVKR